MWPCINFEGCLRGYLFYSSLCKCGSARKKEDEETTRKTFRELELELPEAVDE